MVYQTYSHLNQLRKISSKYLFGEAKKSFQQYETQEQESILYILFEDMFAISKIDFLVNKEIDWSEGHQKQLEGYLDRLNATEPIQYITGKTFFFNSYFEVNNFTLIPRPETEELVQLILTENTLERPHIIDIGTGSGCIAISLAKELKNASVAAVDISTEAISVAKRNAELNQTTVSFIELDFLTQRDKITNTFDIIVSNPPYVLESEIPEMRKNVLEHEPHLALFVEDDDALKYYDALLSFASVHLTAHGYVYAEINEQKGMEMIALAEKYGFAGAVIIKDMFLKDRIFKAQKTNES